MNAYRLLGAGIGCAALLWAAAASATEKPEDNYRTYCVQCHGLQGDGKGINVRDMSVQPRDHTDAKEMAARSDEDLFKAIKEGGVAINKSMLMPGWADVLSDEEIRGLVAYLRELCQCTHGK
ncbi:MAG: cytochrome C class I [Gammaproteobacteria bacterium]|nr:MAG: cytochrome C class I [Gammaproteobacteria bacterium]TND04993.1 MAG: cytochrome C class I [Gammaproteobacteria bacterium]